MIVSWRQLLRLLVALAMLLALPLAEAAVRLLDRADLILAPGTTPPPASSAWKPVTLPDQWRQSRPHEMSDQGWYRIHVTLPADFNPLQAIYLPKVIMNAAVFVNGFPIGDGGSFEEPVARNWNRPLMFLIPPGLLHPGDNVVHVRLRNHAYTQAALHPIELGPEAEIRPRYERAHFLRITLNQTATLLIAAIGILMLSLWMRRRQDRAYAYFGTSALVWAAQSTNLYLQNTGIATAPWEIIVNGGFQVFSSLLLMSLLRFVAAGGGSVIGALWISALLAPLSLWLVPAHDYMPLTALWHLYTLICAVATLALLFRAAVTQHNRDARHLVAAMGIVVLFALHDWLIHSQHVWSGNSVWPFNDVFLLHYSAPVIYLTIGLIMTGRFVQVLNEFERLNDQLEVRVDDKQRQLQDSYARMQKLETEHAVIEERERIYRDLHDDVGAKLLSLVYRAANTEDAELARSALQDLRDVVSRTSADHFRVADVLADWRVECEKRLSEAGLQLHWQQPEQFDANVLTQPQVLNLGRILREAISNVIRHAGATQVSIDLIIRNGHLHISISDDGAGSAPSTQKKPGRGLINMQMRAQRLHGQCKHENLLPRGFRIAVSIPLSPGDTAAVGD